MYFIPDKLKQFLTYSFTSSNCESLIMYVPKCKLVTDSIIYIYIYIYHSCEKAPNSLFYEALHILLSLIFLSPSLFFCLVSYFFLLLVYAECVITKSNVLFYLIIWRTYTCRAYTVGLTNITWILLAPWFDITHKQIHTQHTQGTTDWHRNIY